MVERGSSLAELPYHGHPVRHAALRAVLQASQRLGAGACAVVDASIETVEPEWVEGNLQVWGGWGPHRGRYVPGTAIFLTRLPG